MRQHKSDNSFIIEKNGLLYHVTSDMEEYELLRQEYETAPDNFEEYTEAVFKDTRTYAQKRAMEYPSLGDMVDAFCKSKAGDDSELTLLMATRNEIKTRYPKE